MSRSRRREAFDERWAAIKTTDQRNRLIIIAIIVAFTVLAVIIYVRTHPSIGPYDVNKATAPELESLPGIGPAMADDIIDGRPYRSPEDLDRVSGIGPKTVEKLRPHLTFPGED